MTPPDKAGGTPTDSLVIELFDAFKYEAAALITNKVLNRDECEAIVSSFARIAAGVIELALQERTAERDYCMAKGEQWQQRAAPSPAPDYNKDTIGARQDFERAIYAANPPGEESPAPEVRVPDDLPDELRWILGRPNFMCRDIAIILRKSGRFIATKAEDEQAACIHWMLQMYSKHGKDWRGKGDEELQALLAASTGREK